MAKDKRDFFIEMWKNLGTRMEEGNYNDSALKRTFEGLERQTQIINRVLELRNRPEQFQEKIAILKEKRISQYGDSRAREEVSTFLDNLQNQKISEVLHAIRMARETRNLPEYTILFDAPFSTSVDNARPAITSGDVPLQLYHVLRDALLEDNASDAIIGHDKIWNAFIPNPNGSNQEVEQRFDSWQRAARGLEMQAVPQTPLLETLEP